MPTFRHLLLLLLALSTSACAFRNWQPPWNRQQCVLSPTITKDQLVTHLNRNIQGTATTSGLVSWRSTNAKISASNMPGITVPASIAVEAPRNFRLRVSEPLTRVEALDMGSNASHFWFWAKDARPPQVMTVSHEMMPTAQRELQIPFAPDWLMEVLGVIPIDGSKFTLNRAHVDEPVLELIADIPTSDGSTTRKVIRVDTCTGYIREHALYDGRGILIARAALGEHRADPATGLVVPHVVKFDWPAIQQTMKLSLGRVELNPGQFPASVWQIPEKPGAPMFDLSQLLHQNGGVGPGLYGAGSPFGIMPPPGNSHAVLLESDDGPNSETGQAVLTSGEPNSWWTDAPQAVPHQPSGARAPRAHLTRRPLNPFADGPQ